MKAHLIIACSLALFLAATCPAAAQQTGREALMEVVRRKGPAASEIVTLSGQNGAEQPAAWRLVARDPAFPGRYREYQVKDGRLTSEQAVPAAESSSYASSPLVRAKIRVDSPVVFWRAHTEAKKALVGFDTVDYELRNAEFSTTPVWVVHLINQSGIKVGEVAVSAESGNVLRRTWFEAGRQPAPRPKLTPAEQKTQDAWQGTRTGLHQGKKAVKTGLGKASTTVGGWLLRAGSAMQEPPAPAPAPAPATRP